MAVGVELQLELPAAMREVRRIGLMECAGSGGSCALKQAALSGAELLQVAHEYTSQMVLEFRNWNTRW